MLEFALTGLGGLAVVLLLYLLDWLFSRLD